MKRLLLPLLLFLSYGCQSKPTQWPTSWSQFDPPPSKEERPFVTVKFLNSIDEACKEFKKADKLEYLFQKKVKAIVDPLLEKYKRGYPIEEEWKEKTIAPNIALRRRELKSVSTAVEVLRQADYPDWKLYSRYSFGGVGDLRIKEVKKKGSIINSPNFKYTWAAKGEARDVCRALMP